MPAQGSSEKLARMESAGMLHSNRRTQPFQSPPGHHPGFAAGEGRDPERPASATVAAPVPGLRALAQNRDDARILRPRIRPGLRRAYTPPDVHCRPRPRRAANPSARPSCGAEAFRAGPSHELERCRDPAHRAARSRSAHGDAAPDYFPAGARGRTAAAAPARAPARTPAFEPDAPGASWPAPDRSPAPGPKPREQPSAHSGPAGPLARPLP